MEIDITRLFTGEIETWDLSGSRATHGDNVARTTWNNALRQGRETPFLTTDDEIQALRDDVAGSGFGDDVETYDAEQCNALFLQMVSGDMRESGLDEIDGQGDEAGWAEYQEGAEAGRYSGKISRGWSIATLCETAAVYGWVNYLGTFYHAGPHLAPAGSAVRALALSGVLDHLDCDAVYYYLGN